jgi:D-arabinose 1-dehydrogenase-like Zn-dependent alcohol dehydrogenase
MKAAVMRAFSEPLQVEDVPDPSPSPDGVVVEVRATGVCRSDPCRHGHIGRTIGLADAGAELAAMGDFAQRGVSVIVL